WPRASTGTFAVRSKSACASCHASAFASCCRRVATLNAEPAELAESFVFFSACSARFALIVVSVPLEELDRPLVFFRRSAGRERAEVFPPAAFRIFFPRIQPVFS